MRKMSLGLLRTADKCAYLGTNAPSSARHWTAGLTVFAEKTLEKNVVGVYYYMVLYHGLSLTQLTRSLFGIGTLNADVA